MINRALIRLKILQLLYAYYQKGEQNEKGVLKELQLSLTKAYDLYNYLLLLMVDITRIADEIINEQVERNKVAHVDTMVSLRFIENKFILQLASNTQLMSYVESQKLSWADDRKLLRKLYADITESVFYAEYMVKDSVDYAEDRNLWRKVYKNIIMKSDEIVDSLEGKSLYWNDDKEIVDTFVLKTIKLFDETLGPDQPLIPKFRDEEDQKFAVTLMSKSIENADYYQSLISDSARNWDYNRLALTDKIIMQIAFAEMMTFPDIPISVTINEYVELSKSYSTPKSYMYINGILDTVAKQLKKEHKLFKK